MHLFEKSALQCHEVIGLLGDYIDDELSVAIRQMIDSHIAECSYCAEMLRTYSQTVSLARDLPEKKISNSHKSRLFSKITEKLGIHQKK
jgi:anti-sigma factor RsiW